MSLAEMGEPGRSVNISSTQLVLHGIVAGWKPQAVERQR